MKELKEKMQMWSSELERQGGTMGIEDLLYSIMADYGEQYRKNVRLRKELEECATLIEQQGREMNRLQNMTNKQLLEINGLRIELEEAYKFIQEIADHGGINMRGATCALNARAFLAGQEGEGNQ